MLVSIHILTSQSANLTKDLEYGDTFEVQTKKQKMAARVHRGLPAEVSNQHFDLLASADN